MKRFVDTSLGFPVFYDSTQGMTIPETAKPISEARFQRYVETGSLEPQTRRSTKKGGN